jgi:phosphatidylinositol-3-phosphatase
MMVMRKRRASSWLLALIISLLLPLRPASGGTLPPIRTVFVILMENESFSSIQGNTNAPYLNHVLLSIGAHCEQYYAIGHPSLPNYLWLEAGTDFGIADDNPPSAHHQSTTNHLVSLLKRAGISWRGYDENISGTYVPLTNSYPYAVRHNPFAYFDDVTGTNNPTDAYGIAHMRPYSELARDLTNHSVAAYNFITPNLCHDMHDSCAPVSNQILQGDTWLSQEIPKIMNSSAYTNNGAIFILWDEGTGSATIPMIVLSPLVKRNGYSNTIHYTHSSTLRTIQEIFGVAPLLGDAANATDLTDVFIAPPEPPTNMRVVSARP